MKASLKLMQKSIQNTELLLRNTLSYYHIRFILPFIFNLGGHLINAQAPEWEWVLGSIYGSANAIVVDGADNNYSTGTFIGPADFDQGNGQFTLDGGGAFILKQNASGNLEWVQQLGEWDTCFGISIAVDNSGNVFTTGAFNGTIDFDPGSGVFQLTSAGEDDIFISKLDDQGNFLWAKSLGGTFSDAGSSLATDASGNVYSTGYFNGSADFDPGNGTFTLVSNGSKDIYVSKLDANGNFVWAKGIGSSATDIAKSLALDASANVHITGNFEGTVDFNPNAGIFNLSAVGSSDVFISKLDGSGNFEWAKAVGGVNADLGNGISLDATGNIYTTGTFSGTADFNPGGGVFNLTAVGYIDQFILKLNGTGNLEWVKSIGGDNSVVIGNSISVNAANGNVFTSGGLIGLGDFDPGSGSFFMSSAGVGSDIVVLKLDSSGAFEWALKATGEEEDYAHAIAVDDSENVYLAGRYTSNWINFGNISFDEAFGGGDRLFVAKINNMGVPPLQVVISNSTNVVCNGEQSGSATATASGGITPYTYEWSTGATSPSINDIVAGVYSVSVTDFQGSTAHATVVISQPDPLIFNEPEIMHVSCANGSNGSIQAATNGGVSPYSFEWSNGSSTALVADLPVGSYAVTVTDNNDCTEVATYLITQPLPLEILLENQENESCFDEDDGTISISISGGSDPYNVLWSNGFAGTIITGLSPGDYGVTITDVNLCTATALYSINPGNFIQLTLEEINHVSCAGGSNGSITIEAWGEEDTYSYTWSNGATEPTLTSLAVGTYQVTATDIDGCSAIGAYAITQPESINIQIQHLAENLCYGDSMAALASVVSGGVPPYSGLWSNGIVGFENLNLAAGPYTITITDSHDCISILPDSITQPLALTISVMITNESASGANDGAATLSAEGGIPPYSYIWNTGDTLAEIIGLAPGIYTVTATDSNGCETDGTAIINGFGCALDILLGNDIYLCEEDSFLLQPAITGGNGVLSYLWSDGSVGESLSVYQAGEYCVTISDEGDCQDLDCILINEIIIPPLTCPATDESAPGANDGAIQCDSLAGIISYLWSNDSTTSSIEGLAPGQYCVTLTEQNGCLATQCFIVQPANCQMTVNPVITDVLCAGDTTGAILLITDNGTAPINYTWSAGDTTTAIENLPAGTYSVTVSDVNGCANFDSFTISEPLPLTIGIDSIAPVDPSGSGLIWITAAGGTPDYTYQWVDPLGEIIVSEDLNNLTQSGNYSLVLTDAAGCVTILDSVYVDQNVSLDHATVFKSISVYPVPAKDVLIVNTAYAILEAFITGVDGRVYKHFIKPGDNRFDVADLGPGWYVLRMFDGRDWYVARMVK